MTEMQRRGLVNTVIEGLSDGNLPYMIRLEQVVSECPSVRTEKFVHEHITDFDNPEHWLHLWFEERFQMWDYEIKIIGL